MEKYALSNDEWSDLKLEDIIDVDSLDVLLDNFCELTGYGVGIIDIDGKVLVAKRWQTICMQFHRVHPVSNRNCLESDTLLSSSVNRGEYKVYKCKNHMWDIATPIFIKDRHMGNIFLGQFFYDDEVIDVDLFAKQAEQYGFDKQVYLKALKNVPVWSREEVNRVMRFYSKLAEIISDLGYQNVVLQKLLEERRQELEKSENKLNALFKSMSETAVLYEMLYDANGQAVDYCPLDYNQSFLKQFNLSSEALRGKTIRDLPNVKPDLNLELYWEVIVQQKHVEHMEYIPSLNKHFITSVSPSGTNQFITISTDISEIKEMQEILASKNRELENYLYVASHDLRSPLVNIQGFAQRLKMQTDDVQALLENEKIAEQTREKLNEIFETKIPKTLEFIFNNVNKMDTLIKGLLTISRTGRAEMCVEAIEMDQLLQQILDSINFQLQEENIAVQMGDIPSCYGDYNLLNRLFTNLIDNAIKYKDPERNLVISLSGQQENKFTVYRMTDNGLGIAERHIQKIWDVFYRVDPIHSGKGEGLGLSIVKTIVDKHKGKIAITSEEGKGTQITVKLPNIAFKTGGQE